MILAIDPGNTESGYVYLDNNLKPIDFGKTNNEVLKGFIECGCFEGCDHIAIEMIASYGMAVGATVFDTCVWIGKFCEKLESELNIIPVYIYRKDEKMNLCGTMKAKDTNIRQALIDRFGIVGKKKEPGFFYGFKADMWAAMAVGVTFSDMYLKGDN
jgi:hypothetical protein